MKYLMTFVMLTMFGSTALCQITGISRNQKIEIVSTLIAYPVVLEENEVLSISITEYERVVKDLEQKNKLHQLNEADFLNLIEEKDNQLQAYKKHSNKAKSGLFLFGQTNINGFNNYALGLDYQFKNTIILGLNTNYNALYFDTTLNVKFGVKIF